MHSLFARHTLNTLTIPTPLGDHVKDLKWIWPCQDSSRHVQRDQMKFFVVQMHAFGAILRPKETDRGFEDDGIGQTDSITRAHQASICFA